MFQRLALDIESLLFRESYNCIEVLQIDIFFGYIQLFEFVDYFQRTICHKVIDRRECTGGMLAFLIAGNIRSFSKVYFRIPMICKPIKTLSGCDDAEIPYLIPCLILIDFLHICYFFAGKSSAGMFSFTRTPPFAVSLAMILLMLSRPLGILSSASMVSLLFCHEIR